MAAVAKLGSAKKWLGFFLLFFAVSRMNGWEAQSAPLVLGDLDCDGQLTLTDIVFELNKVFLGEPYCAPEISGEVNCDAIFSAADVVWLLNRVYLQTPFPCSLDCYDPIQLRDTCKILPLKVDENAAWSPDGHTIAYYHRNIGFLPGDTAGIHLIDSSGTNERILIPSAHAIHPAFSPDGQWLAFANTFDNSIYKMKLNRDSLTRLTFNGDHDQSPNWSPDGNWILYVRPIGGDAGIRLVDKNGQNDRLLILYGGEPNWSKEGTRILCGQFILEDSVYKPYVGIFSIVDSSFKKITLLGGTWQYWRWSSDNSKILMTVTEPNNPCITGGTFLYVMDSTGQSFQKLLTTLSLEGAWSPDGSKIVYTDSRPEFGTLFITDADGGNKKQLTFRPK